MYILNGCFELSLDEVCLDGACVSGSLVSGTVHSEVSEVLGDPLTMVLKKVKRFSNFQHFFPFVLQLRFLVSFTFNFN